MRRLVAVLKWISSAAFCLSLMALLLFIAALLPVYGGIVSAAIVFALFLHCRRFCRTEHGITLRPVGDGAVMKATVGVWNRGTGRIVICQAGIGIFSMFENRMFPLAASQFPIEIGRKSTGRMEIFFERGFFDENNAKLYYAIDVRAGHGGPLVLRILRRFLFFIPSLNPKLVVKIADPRELQGAFSPGITMLGR